MLTEEKKKIPIEAADMREIIKGIATEVATEVAKAVVVAIRPTDADHFSAEQKAKLEEQVRDEWKAQRAMQHRFIQVIKLPEDMEDEVYIGVNGVSYWVKKGQTVPLPLCCLEALDHAQVDYTKTEIDELGQKVTKQVKYLRYPYTVERDCSPEEAHNWREKNARLLG